MWKSWISPFATRGINTIKKKKEGLTTFQSSQRMPTYTGPENLSWEFKRKCSRLQIIFVSRSPSSLLYRMFVRHGRSKQIWSILIQADGLVVDIVKGFTERLQQLKDITELQALRDLPGPAPHGSQHYPFLLIRKTTQPSACKVTGEGRGKNAIFVQRSTNVRTETGNTDWPKGN